MSFDLAGVVDGLAGATGAAVTVESALWSPITVPLASGQSSNGTGAAQDAASPPPLLYRLLRPRVTVSALGAAFKFQPAGDPPAVPVLGFVVAFGAVAVLGLAIYGGVRLLRG